MSNVEYKSITLNDFQIDEKGIIDGYGAVFDNVDHGNDIIHKGAFLKSLENKTTYPILWQHNTDMPLGLWDCSEDDHGLKSHGKLLIDDVQQAKEAYALYKNGVISGLSIGFICKSCTWEENKDVGFIRHINEIELFEISLVTFPCNEKATVTDVKSNGDLSIRTAEKALISSGFSHKQAKTILSQGFKALKNDDCDDQQTERDVQNQIELINSFFNKLKGN